MNLNAVGIASGNITKTLEFYKLLGFEFGKPMGDHYESSVTSSFAKLMIDSKDVVKEIIGEDPKPGNHSSFAIQYDSPKEVNDIALKIQQAGFTIFKEPWDAFLGTTLRRCSRPRDGYKVDLYADLEKTP
ncbi:glyoxalase [Candidatus Roizmanbacteria bacterium CG_4_9_14_0_2_um_filter_39_13]|uniref:Glyoxalase n=2 Tax=Candidatus Roizmaniibacteriota TaxID=1752723 RepID=A0A2M8EZP1_9BACT|nr:MAG: glyoxalase [Candidatus Roizmanbacteria bacterium CG_4_10_14_0_2_um_filter_39_12]PJC32523.1 MAG: glyoxalase [Candidatus Roizmanbacteria bacterium CG_4_9_14_0_2_um_filter_39_13]PJE61910.1 MAG: glyoxalase [Candidatus Roizmanbacteria bacterium CG10_big_fil_rev_8_21_14_0_10_39_12]